MKGIVKSELVGNGLVLWSGEAGKTRGYCESRIWLYFKSNDFYQVYSPSIMLYRTWDSFVTGMNLYRGNLSKFQSLDKEDYFLNSHKVINHILMEKDNQKSYRDLPTKLWEFSEFYDKVHDKITNRFSIHLSVFDKKPASLEVEANEVLRLASMFKLDGSIVFGQKELEDKYTSQDGNRCNLYVSFAQIIMETPGNDEK